MKNSTNPTIQFYPFVRIAMELLCGWHNLQSSKGIRVMYYIPKVLSEHKSQLSPYVPPVLPLVFSVFFAPLFSQSVMKRAPFNNLTLS